MDTLCLKLKKDLKSELELYSKEKEYTLEDIDTLIDDVVKPGLFNFNIQEYDETKCQASVFLSLTRV